MWLLPALFVLVLIAWVAVSMWGAGNEGAEWDVTGQITDVDVGGPAERAGLRVGDELLAIDDCPIKAWDKCSYRILRPGDTTAFTFRREGQVHTTVVVAELPAVNYRLVLVLILLVALVFCLSALVLLLGQPASAEVRTFYVLCQMAASSLAYGTLVIAIVPYGPRWLHILNGMLPPVLVHFHAIFPEQHRLAQKRGLLEVLYGTGLTLVVLRWLRPLLSYPPIQTSHTIMQVWLSLGFVAAIVLAVTTYVTTASPYARRRIRLLVLGTVLGVGPVGVVSAAPKAGFGGEAWIRWPYVIPLMGLLPVAYAVALWRYRLTDFDRALNRGLVYLVVSALLFGAYFAALMLFYNLLPVDMVGRAVLGAAAALVAAVTLRPLRERVQRLVDRLFYGGWYDYRGLVEQVGQALACTLDLETLVEVLVHQVPHAMHLPGAVLWLERKGKMEVAGASGVGTTLAVDPVETTPAANPVGATLAVAQHGSTLAAAPAQGEVKITHHHAVVPLYVEGQVIGIWMLAARPGGEWGPEDGRILTALGRQAALVAQNVRLVVALRAKVAEVEEMHRRLLTAREEERADLARELHDGVIQDLIGLRYQLEACGGAGEQGSGGEAYTEAGLLVDDLRRLCSDLRPSALDQLGLAAALQALAREVTARGLPVEVHLENVALPDRVAIGLYRIGQEALSNAWRHAWASKAIVALAHEGDEIVLTVADDGRGFDPAAVRGQDKRFGLLGMSERAEALGGHLTIQSAPGQGTQVTVRCAC